MNVEGQLRKIARSVTKYNFINAIIWMIDSIYSENLVINTNYSSITAHLTGTAFIESFPSKTNPNKTSRWFRSGRCRSLHVINETVGEKRNLFLLSFPSNVELIL